MWNVPFTPEKLGSEEIPRGAENAEDTENITEMRKIRLTGFIVTLFLGDPLSLLKMVSAIPKHRPSSQEIKGCCQSTYLKG